MHDGSLATLEDVVRHYEKGGVRRPTRSKDLPQNLKLTDTGAGRPGRVPAVAVERQPAPALDGSVGGRRPAGAAAAPQDTTVISQADKQFRPAHVRLKAGQTLTVLNDDTRTHNVRIFDPRLDFNSGAQEPKESVTIRFPAAGTYQAFCGIHPSMRLTVEVE